MNTIRNHFWSLVLTFLFGIMVLMGSAAMVTAPAFHMPTLTEIILLSLAVMRLTRLVCYDAIMHFVHDWFKDARPKSLRGQLYVLVNCPWCTGLWFAFFVALIFYVVPSLWPVIVILAIAALGSFFQIIANLLGWSAEGKKLEVQKLQRAAAPKE